MTNDEIRGAVLDALREIAPEADPATLEPGTAFRDQLDMDSMDFLHFVVAVHRKLGVEVPEADYPRLATLDGCVAYVAAKLGGR
jgi:acyl carrier protein